MKWYVPFLQMILVGCLIEFVFMIFNESINEIRKEAIKRFWSYLKNPVRSTLSQQNVGEGGHDG